ncbi:DUF3299 domain-containing protein [Alteromonas sp. BMJM2]|uniref:DUF3299 domain-containing protein n=1 Tax=Alteromonas sp. BMJM2 TaxID=2954241 RepID=UPI0022B3E7C4|nr:DUF3299 domain-containing protein [Alteromonas sp. BMJM2]
MPSSFNYSRLFLWLFVITAGLLGGHLVATHYKRVIALVTPSDVVYKNAVDWYEEDIHFSLTPWEVLLPEQEKKLLEKYQVKEAKTVNDITAQLLNSIESASDPQYRQALVSMNTVEELAGQHISISGFLVPIDFYPNKDVKRLFVVPYFGACIHYPPPPPNQMIYVQLEPGFNTFDINQAYTLKGKLTTALYEDVAGTSAYVLNTASISTFTGQSDTFRSHSR